LELVPKDNTVSKPLIIGAMAVATADTSIANMRKAHSGHPTSRIIIGGWLITVMLLFGAEVNEPLADMFALLVLVSTLAGPNNNALFSALVNATSNGVNVTVKKGQS
jgi:hypothetical protein